MSTVSTVDSTTEESRPEVQFHVHQDKDGAVAATVPVSWTLNAPAIKFVAEQRANHPRLLVVVASVHERHNYYNGGTHVDYRTTAVYDVPLLNSKGEPTTPKRFLSFARPGKNIIVGTIFTTTKPAAVSRVVGQLDATVYPEGLDLTIESSYAKDITFANQRTSSYATVEVPSEMFAPEPAQWQKNLVNQFAWFFDGREEDQCHFRKRFFTSLLLSIPVQLYGVVARIIRFTLAILVGERRAFNKALFALNPHDYSRQLGRSYWLEDDKGRARPLHRAILSPPGLLLSAFLLFASVSPGLIIVAYWDEAHGNGDGWPNLWASWALGWGFWLCVGVLWTGLTVVYVQSKIRQGTVPYGGFDNPIAEAIRQRLQSKTPKSNAPQAKLVERTLLQLEAAQLAAREPDEVSNGTIRLKVAALKAAVCKPFAK